MKKQEQKVEKKTKKPLPKVLKITFGLLLCFVLLGGIGIGIYCLIKAITVRWFIFVALIPIIPFGIANFKRLVFRKGKYTVEQNKQANVKCIYTLFYWLCDLFYMSFLIDSLALKFIFGGLIMLVIFMNLVKSFTYPKERTGFESWFLLQDFLVGIGLSIYLIYIIPCVDIKEVVIPVIAAVYSGLITLVGVAWTIRKSDHDRKDEERKKARPVFTFNPIYERLENVKGVKFVFDDYGKPIDKLVSVFPYNVFMQIENSEHSSFSVERMYHDKQWWQIAGCKYVLPNKAIYFEFNFSDNPDEIFVEIKDMLENLYYYKISVICLNLLNKQPIYNGQQIAHTVREYKEISFEEIKAITSDEEKTDNA